MREVMGGKTPGHPTTVNWAIDYVVDAIGDVKLAKLRPADFRRVHEFRSKYRRFPGEKLEINLRQTRPFSTHARVLEYLIDHAGDRE